MLKNSVNIFCIFNRFLVTSNSQPNAPKRKQSLPFAQFLAPAIGIRRLKEGNCWSCSGGCQQVNFFYIMSLLEVSLTVVGSVFLRPDAINSWDFFCRRSLNKVAISSWISPVRRRALNTSLDLVNSWQQTSISVLTWKSTEDLNIGKDSSSSNEG